MAGHDEEAKRSSGLDLGPGDRGGPSDADLASVLDSLPVGVFVLDSAGHPCYANRAAQQMLGRGADPDLGSADLTLLYDAYVRGRTERYPTERLPLVRALSGEVATVDDMEIRPLGRMAIPIEVWAAPVRDEHGAIRFAAAVFNDITRRFEPDEDDQGGTTASGPKPGPRPRGTVERSEVDLVAFVDGLVPMLTRALPDEIKLSVAGEPGRYPARIDTAGLRQVLMDLTNNARDAIAGSGHIRIGLSQADAEEGTDDHPALPATAVLQVIDDGVGMTPRVLAGALERLFTTKPPGGETVLRLMHARETVVQHGGKIDIASSENGTCVSLWIPMSRTASEPD